MANLDPSRAAHAWLTELENTAKAARLALEQVLPHLTQIEATAQELAPGVGPIAQGIAQATGHETQLETAVHDTETVVGDVAKAAATAAEIAAKF